LPEVLAGGRYRLVRSLAKGGMGEVLLAEFPGDTTLAITPGYVVLKRVLPDAHNRPHQVRMLREEGRISLRLLHENLVESFFVDEHEGDPILVMEFLAGRSVAQLLGLAKKNKDMLPIDATLALMRASACGLHFAHTLTDRGKPLGLIHRDVSPANVFITFDGRTKVIDFGVAKADDSEIRTSTGVLKGKLGYMSPEHASGDIKLTPAADLWSLGVLMWESLCAERLFASQSPSETLRAIAEKPVPPPTVLRKDIPPGVVSICMGLLERDVDRRIATGQELVHAIDALPDAAALARVDLGAFLATRFPDDVQAGREDAKKCARMRRRTPIPMGLVEGTAAAIPHEGETPTIVLKAEDARAALAQARAASADTQKLSPVQITEDASDENAPTRRVLARGGGLLAEPDSAPSDEAVAEQGTAQGAEHAEDSIEVDLSTRTQRIAELPPLGRPIEVGAGERRVRTASRTMPDTRKLRRTTSLVSVALLTFGLLAVVMGLMFSTIAPPRSTATVVFHYADPARGPSFVGQAQDVPADLVATPVDVSRPAWPGSAAMSSEEIERLRERLATSGVLERASLPATLRAQVASLLPLLMAGLGLLALALAMPGFLLSPGAVRVAVRAALGLAVLGLLGFLIERGALTWPGRVAWDDVPRASLKSP
jgi:Protein kinase domain